MAASLSTAWKSQSKSRFRRRLFAWFGRHQRNFPWRQTRDPYCIWVSEIMLQQTQAATVVPYYRRFLERFPTLASLAEVDEHEVLRYWEGLGYYRRARQLHQAARILQQQHEGNFPRRSSDLQALPGIGRYTSGAVLSIAYDAREPILEANTSRLFCRLLGYEGDPKSSAGQQVLWAFAQAILPRKGCGQFNQALMELGAEVCRPRSPRCTRCPVESLCVARRNGKVKEIPAAAKKTCYEEVHEASVIVRHDGKLLLRKRQSDERWAGLWDFPRFELDKEGDDSDRKYRRKLAQGIRDLTGYSVMVGDRFATIKHGVTRFKITLSCYFATLCGAKTVDEDRGNPQRAQKRKGSNLRWATHDELKQLALSTPGRKIASLINDDSSNPSSP